MSNVPQDLNVSDDCARQDVEDTKCIQIQDLAILPPYAVVFLKHVPLVPHKDSTKDTPYCVCNIIGKKPFDMEHS